MQEAIDDIAEKRTHLTIQELKRLLYRCASAIISLPTVGFDVSIAREAIEQSLVVSS